MKPNLTVPMNRWPLALGILIFSLASFSCGHSNKKQADLTEKDSTSHLDSSIYSVADAITGFHKLDKLFVTGDFDGDGRKDTLFEHIYSGITKTEIDSAASPFENEWELVEKWFYEQDAKLYISFSKANKDTLRLGIAQGLYCLLNVGDNNGDGKDEIAFVVDHLDYSRVNTCHIYSICHNKWTAIKAFDIHEDAFNFTGDKAPVFTKIDEYLEKQNGKWYYLDFHQVYDRVEDVGKMIRLKTNKCN